MQADHLTEKLFRRSQGQPPDLDDPDDHHVAPPATVGAAFYGAAMLEISTWTAVVVAVVTPLLAFAGSLLGSWWARRSALELDRWRRREETMRLLRWAVELATERAQDKRKAGITAINALSDSELLQREDRELVAAVTRSLLPDSIQAYDETGDVVVRDDGPSVGATRTDDQGADHDRQ